MTPADKQLLAKRIFELDWAKVQCDDMHENERMIYLRDQIASSDMTKEETVTFLFEVLEARDLTLRYPTDDSPFKDMGEFKYLS